VAVNLKEPIRGTPLQKLNELPHNGASVILAKIKPSGSLQALRTKGTGGIAFLWRYSVCTDSGGSVSMREHIGIYDPDLPADNVAGDRYSFEAALRKAEALAQEHHAELRAEELRQKEAMMRKAGVLTGPATLRDQIAAAMALLIDNGYVVSKVPLTSAVAAVQPTPAPVAAPPSKLPRRGTSVPVEPRAYSIAAFARVFSIGRTSVFLEMSMGRLRSYKVGGKRYIKASDAEEWQRAHQAETREHATAE